MKTYSRKKQGDSTDVIIHLNELCRLCLAKEDELVPIFNDDDPIPLTLRIMACVSLVVFEGDGLPNMICHPCRYQLDKSYAFKKKCENSDIKLRRHIKSIQEKGGSIEDATDITEDVPNTEKEFEEGDKLKTETPNNDTTMDTEIPISSEQDFVGARVAYIDPESDIREENMDPENITLSLETDEINKDACTLKNLPLKCEVEEDPEELLEEKDGKSDSTMFLVSDDQPDEQQFIVTDSYNIDQNYLPAIADAVKATLAQQPGIDISGQIQMKVDNVPGKPTQIQVTTADGSVIIMELLTEEEHQGDDGEDEELKVFQCPNCPKAFSRRIQLRRHSSVHMEQRGFSCGICEKWFPTRSALIRHERIHTGERPFKCEMCPKSFAQKEILYRHLMIHTGQKPFNCPQCGKGFTQREPLRVHMRSHTTPSPADIQLHRCTLCPKMFCHASGLSRHLVTHTGKTFKCRDCDKAFTDKSSLRRHHKISNHQP
ncbi:zinc finger protein 184 [Chrysoperla carnea]|uniref:zinc finger protein 184 n=1 Tax=Chrysoperla carnea TaxID=189513 RepID=UPI001D05E673|nr:zinc finger protein 184 [Chrysoperla carnea]